MAITDLNGVISGLLPPVTFLKTFGFGAANVFFTGYYSGSLPAAAAVTTTGGAGIGLSGSSAGGTGSTTGQILFYTGSTGDYHLAKLKVSSTQTGTLYLCDRLWHRLITGTDTTLQTVNSTFPSRDVYSSTNGVGVFIGIENTGLMSNATITVNYTSMSGASTYTTTTLASLTQDAFTPIPLGSGHTGVRSIQTFQLSASIGSDAVLVAYKILASIDCKIIGETYSIDAITSGFPLLSPQTFPFLLWISSSATAPTITGEITYTQG